MPADDDNTVRFQSTLPARGATGDEWKDRYHNAISIHAPRTGSDSLTIQTARPDAISIHAPRTGSDLLPRLCLG